MKHIFYISVLFLFLFCLSSCASDGDGVTGRIYSSSDGEAKKYISFTLSVRGEVQGNHYYCILLNNQCESVEVSNSGTYTDVIRVYNNSMLGPTTQWFHRVENIADHEFQFTSITMLDDYAYFPPDNSYVRFIFPLDDSSVVFNQFVQSNRFTVQAVTARAEGNIVMGPIVDAIGQGPDISVNALYTMTVDRLNGLLKPYPAGYPNDPVGDIDSADPNLDITSFRVEVY